MRRLLKKKNNMASGTSSGTSPHPAGRQQKNRPPLEAYDVTNYIYHDSPHPKIECRVPGLSQESFDREWNPKVTSVMWVDALCRRYAQNRPLPDLGGSGNTRLGSGSKSAGDSSENSVKAPSGNCASNHGGAGEGSATGVREWSSQDRERAFLNWHRIEQEMYAFGACAEFTMTRALYDPNVPKWPLDFRFTFGFVGSCSVANTTEFYSCEDSCGKRALLWTNTYQLVMVDKKKRQPTRIPAWFKDKYQGRGCLDKAMVIRPFDRPDVTYCHPVTVQWSDTDDYGHANWSTYIRWATDALRAALLPRNRSSYSSSRKATTANTRADGNTCVFGGITKETMEQGLAKFRVVYLRESVEGDKLEIHVWQEAEGEKEQLVWCSVVKEGEDICSIKLWYFPQDTDSS